MRVELGYGSASGGAMIFEGWKPVSASARMISGSGQAIVYLDKLELSGMTVPNSPDIRLGQPFRLKHRIERLELSPAGFAVVMRR